MNSSDVARPRRWIAGTLAAAAAAVAFGATAERASALEIGLQDDSVFVSQRFGYDQEKAYEQAVNLGVTMLRVNVNWNDFAKTGFAPYDRVVTRAAKHGMRVQMTLYGTTKLDKKPDRRLTYRNPSPRRFAAFAKRFARRYKGRVNRYSIWNEPNYPYFLSPQSRAPQIYRALYLAGYRAIKSVSSRIKVFIGELGPNHDPLGFLARVATGLRADGLAYHPFQWTAAPGAFVAERTHVGISNTPRIKATLRALRRQRRLRTPRGRTVPIYFTEFAYPSSVIRSDARRADWTVRAYRVARRHGVRQLVYYTLVQPPRGSGIFFNSGMVHPDGSPTTVYTSLLKYLTGR
jgi:hypothetical protein